MKAVARKSAHSFIFIYLLLAGISLHAKQDKMNITGMYFMRGVMETASVIALTFVTGSIFVNNSAGYWQR